MPFSHKLQGSRFELKYVVDEACAQAMLEFASSYLTPDEHARPELAWAYRVYSLYLDSPDLRLLRSSETGEKNRFKLRVRFYDDNPNSPVYCEIKRRVDDVILKQRGALRREALDRLLAGQQPARQEMVRVNGSAGAEYGALQRFAELRSNLRADGRVLIAYVRQAFVTPRDNTVRLTFDRELRACRFGRHIRVAEIGSWTDSPVGGVIVEMKFTDRFPVWMREMARVFDLERRSVCKYVNCSRALVGVEPAFLPGYREVRL